MPIALATFAILKQPYGHDEVQEFDDRTPDVFQQAEQAEGFIARAKEENNSERSNANRSWGVWGEFCTPNFYTLGLDDHNDQRASTVSLWKDLASVYNYVYSGLHLSALKGKKQWFQSLGFPTYAIWWCKDGEQPTWKIASEKLDLLHMNGPTKDSFTFLLCFDENGNTRKLSELIK